MKSLSGILSARRAGNVLTRCHFLVSDAGDLSAGRLSAAGFILFVDVNPTRDDDDDGVNRWRPKVWICSFFARFGEWRKKSETRTLNSS